MFWFVNIELDTIRASWHFERPSIGQITYCTSWLYNVLVADFGWKTNHAVGFTDVVFHSPMYHIFIEVIIYITKMIEEHIKTEEQKEQITIEEQPCLLCLDETATYWTVSIDQSRAYIQLTLLRTIFLFWRNQTMQQMRGRWRLNLESEEQGWLNFWFGFQATHGPFSVHWTIFLVTAVMSWW